MNYLQHNKVNYNVNLSSPNNVFYDDHNFFTDIIEIAKYTNTNTSTIKNIEYSSDNITVYNNATIDTSAYTKVLECTSFNEPMNSLLYNISITLSSSDFTAIPDDAKVSFTISVNDTTIKQATFDVQPYAINTYNFFDIIKVNNSITSFTISASSTTPLTVYDIQKTAKQHIPMNCFVYM